MANADLVLLHQCHNQMELALVKSLLEGQGIAFVAQGEHSSSMLSGHMAMSVVATRVLVSGDDYEQAKALLEAIPSDDENPDTATVTVGDAVCPVHEREALTTCDRCGTFLCSGCGTLGSPPLCENCIELEAPAPRARGVMSSFVRRVSQVMGVAIVIGLILRLAGCA